LGWGGFVTQKLQTSQIKARMVALIYNWWNLFVRLAIPTNTMRTLPVDRCYSAAWAD
jgi:hypothetical protein